MKSKIQQHPIQQLSSLLLFLIFVLFLLPVLILSAGAYRTSVEGENLNYNLYTAVNYITTKFRQHETPTGKIRNTGLDPDGSGQEGTALKGILVSTMPRSETGTRIRVTTFEGLNALAFDDEIDGNIYHTWLFLKDGELKELYAMEGVMPDASMGSTIAELTFFEVEEDSQGLYWFTLQDKDGRSSRFCLHAGVPGSSSENNEPADKTPYAEEVA